MKLQKHITIFIMSLILIGCAQETTIGYDVYEQKALDEWMAKYAPQAIRMDNGAYYEVLVPPQSGATKITADKWLILSYIIKDLEGNVVLTRSEAMARQQGTFTKYTHYVPDFAYLQSESNSTMIQGQYLNLLEMSEGEVRRLYLPSKLGYGSSSLSNSAGYGGQYSLSGSKPFIVDSLKVLKIVDDAQIRDNNMADSIASAFGMNLADSIKSHYHMKKLYTNIQGDTVKKDSTARIYYVGRLADGFIFDTNIDSIRRRVYGEVRQSSDTAALVFKPSDATAIPAVIFEPAAKIDTLRPDKCFFYGDTIRIVVSSYYAYGIGGRTGYTVTTSTSSDYTSPYYGGYGYGSYGYGYGYDSYYYGSSYYDGYYDYQNTTSTIVLRTEILPYTPLIYDFVVMKKK